MKTCNFPSVIEARRIAAKQLEFYTQMMDQKKPAPQRTTQESKTVGR
jgi:hypothetical protein